MQVGLRAPLQHSEDAGLGPDGEEHEDGEHAAGRDVVAVNEAEGVRDGVPHPVEGAALATELGEPFGESDVVEVADHIHATVEVEQGAHDGTGTQAESVVDLVWDLELLSLGEGLKTRDGGTNRELEVEGPELSALVDEGVDMVLNAKAVVERFRALHDAEKIVIAPKEHVESHFNVVAVAVEPGADLAADVGSYLEHLDVVAGIGQIHGGHHTGEAGANDTDLELLLVLLPGTGNRALHEVGIEEGVVSDLLLGAIRGERLVDARGGHAEGGGGAGSEGYVGRGGKGGAAQRRGEDCRGGKLEADHPWRILWVP